MLASILENYSPAEAADLFTLHADPKQSGGSISAALGVTGKIILTEAQFNLVKKVYPKCFSSGMGRFSLTENIMILQFFMNLRTFYHILTRGNGSSGQISSRPSTSSVS